MPEYHGWTHAPKAAGGTDPIPGMKTGLPSGYLYSTPGAIGPGGTLRVFNPGTTGLIGKTTDNAIIDPDIATDGDLQIQVTGIYHIRFMGTWNFSHANRQATIDLGVTQFGGGSLGGQGSVATAAGGGGQIPTCTTQGFTLELTVVVSFHAAGDYITAFVGDPVGGTVSAAMLVVTRFGDVPTLN